MRRLPGGAWWFSRRLGYAVPYSGSVRATVQELRPGYARLTVREHRAIRQHLGSVHAVALVNLGELTSGLAMLTGTPSHLRAIVTRLSADFFKKARGLLTAEATVVVPEVSGPIDFPVAADIHDSSGDLVCRVEARWRLDLR